MHILGIHPGHDASVALLKDGKLIFASEEERYSKIKHHFGFPYLSIRSALDFTGLSLDDIDYFAFSPSTGIDMQNAFYYASEATKMFGNLLWAYGFKEAKAVIRERMNYQKLQKIEADKNKNEFNFERKRSFSVDHHLAHAASSYYCSGFKESVFVSWDYAGASVSTALGYGKGEEIITKYRIGFPNSLGYLYAYITNFLAFKPWSDEGKVMGLAPYGKNTYDFSKLVTLDGYNHKINPRYLNLIDFEKSFGDKDIVRFSKEIENFLGPSYEKFRFDENAKNIACSLQTKIEEICLDIVRSLTGEFKIRNLCISGGLGLNCKLNGEILRSGIIDNIFAPPTPNDTGLSVGAALYLHKKLGYEMNYVMEHAYYGPEYSDSEIERALQKSDYDYEKCNDISKTSAELLADNHVIGWYQGRMEFGPRALGNRSILANPKDGKMKDIVNIMKKRELWRPLTPSFLAEKVAEYVENPRSSPFMTLAFRIKKEKAGEIPAVVHVDGTARVQTVEKKVNPKYWSLINELNRLNGAPCVLNTSMNVAGMPIALTPEDALFTMEKMGMDYMAVGAFLVRRKDKV